MAPAAVLSWDPVLLISEIVCMQSLHYLTLSLLIPPLLSSFAQSESLIYEGGASNVGMIMDWREMAGKPTVRGIQGENPWNSFRGAWSGGKLLGYSRKATGTPPPWAAGVDPLRGWIIALCWMLACTADVYYLYMIIRKPRLILDFALTLVFNHLVLTTYYSASIPTSLFFWVVTLCGSAITIVAAEQLCVKREMREGLAVTTIPQEDPDDEDRTDSMELGNLSRRD